MKIWSAGNRQAIVYVVGYASVIAYAWFKKPEFNDFASAIQWLMGIVLGAHIGSKIQDKLPDKGTNRNVVAP